jgi:hypothetical protein
VRRDATRGRTCARVVQFVREGAGSAAGAVPRRGAGGRRRAGGGAGWALLVLAAGELFVFERDHLDRAERDALDRTRRALHDAGEALRLLAARLRGAAERRR